MVRVKSRNRSRSKIKRKSVFNKVFDKIFVISLYDQVKKYEKVKTQFQKLNIDIDRFIAVDGRCKNQTDAGCIDKLNSFEIMFDIKITNKNDLELKELVPASSLTIGTILLLRKMIKENWQHILICEDDIELTDSIETEFKKGINEIGDYKWDLLYLGCGTFCGLKGVSYEESDINKYYSELGEIYEDDYFISNQNDLRMPCEDTCKEFSERISIPYKPGGTWAYAYSLSGAKKLLKLLDNDAGNHIDQLITKHLTGRNKLKALAFDPPIVYHERIINRETSTIPWEW